MYPSNQDSGMQALKRQSTLPPLLPSSRDPGNKEMQQGGSKETGGSKQTGGSKDITSANQHDVPFSPPARDPMAPPMPKNKTNNQQTLTQLFPGSPESSKGITSYPSPDPNQITSYPTKFTNATQLAVKNRLLPNSDRIGTPDRTNIPLGRANTNSNKPIPVGYTPGKYLSGGNEGSPAGLSPSQKAIISTSNRTGSTRGNPMDVIKKNDRTNTTDRAPTDRELFNSEFHFDPDQHERSPSQRIADVVDRPGQSELDAFHYPKQANTNQWKPNTAETRQGYF